MGFSTGSDGAGSGAATAVLRAVPGTREVNQDDVRVIEPIRQGDQEGLAAAYAQHARAVHDFARCIVHDPSLAEDVVQDVFVRLWNRPDHFDPARGTLRNYLLTIAHGRSIDLLRSESARRRREERDALLAPDRGPQDRMDELVTDHDVVHTALGRLQPTEREAIALAYFGGYSYREVASILTVPEGTIKNRIRTGLAHLRVELGDDGESAGDPMIDATTETVTP